MSKRGFHYVYPNLIAILKGINGPAGGFWTDLNRRVYSRLIRPEDADFAITFPYLCVPLVQTAPIYETEESSVVETRRTGIFGFVEETERGFEALVGNVAALKLREDVFRVIATDYKLRGFAADGTEVEDSRFVSGGEEIGGVIPGDTWAEFEIVLEIDIRFSSSDVGPNATT